MVRMASMRMLLLEFWNPIPLVGLVTGRFENNGIWLMLVGEGAVFPIIVYSGLPPNVPIGEVPTLPAPPTVVVPLPHPKPNWVPMSRAKLRVAATTRASISTSCVLRSSCASRRSTPGNTTGISSMISALVRSSAITSPRWVRNFLMIGTTSLECA